MAATGTDVPVWVHNKAKRYVTNAQGRNGAFREAKRDVGVPMSQQPRQVNRVPMTDKYGRPVLDANKKPIMTREYVYDGPNGKTVVIQEHSAGHSFGEPGGIGDQGPHFNVRPTDPTTGGASRHGTVPGANEHYPF